MVNRDVWQCFKLEDASFIQGLSLKIARYRQQRPLTVKMKNCVSNSSSTLLLNHLRHVSLWLFQEEQSLLFESCGIKQRLLEMNQTCQQVFLQLSPLFSAPMWHQLFAHKNNIYGSKGTLMELFVLRIQMDSQLKVSCKGQEE